MPKQWYKSRTLWFNIAWLVMTVLAAVLGPSFQPSPDVVALGQWVAVGFPLVFNMILRTQTSQPLGDPSTAPHWPPDMPQ